MDRQDSESRARLAAFDAVCGVEDHGVPLENRLPADLCERIADAAVNAYLNSIQEAALRPDSPCP